MSRTLIKDASKEVGKKVTCCGWVNGRRDHGKIVFIDLRDRTGILQVVIGDSCDSNKKIDDIRSEWVLEITGEIKSRPEKMINQNSPSGKVEMEAKHIEVLNPAKTLPFEITKDTSKVEEELRLKYRYLDLRSERMNHHITLRHEVIKFIRKYLWERDFREIETPYLTKSTPEGAREFIVPSRQYPGDFYVLPQSPQQFKQLLMVAGIERYFQIVRCFRDEDQRGDRQPEFTQLDMEMSFVSQEDIWELIEPMMIELVETLIPNARIIQKPFPRISYADAIKKYQSDKPDLRKDKNNNKEFAFAWIVDMPMFVNSKSEKKLVSKHHLFTSPNTLDIDKLDKNPENVRAYAYDLVLNGFEIFGGSIRIHERGLQQKIFKILGIPDDEAKRRFGHMLSAFEYGAPPHGGIASGLDRVCCILAGEKVIREAMAFPKTGDARDPLMDAPGPITEEQLKTAHIKVEEKVKNRVLKSKNTETND